MLNINTYSSYIMKMNFINHLTSSNNSTNNTKQIISQMPNRTDRARMKSIINTKITPNNIIKKNDDIGKVAWGAPTWTALHTMAEKIDEHFFAKNSLSVLKIIQAICYNLPCELCSNHAKQYMNKISFSTVRTNDDFKRFLFDFHNEVNKRKGYPSYTIERLHTEYKNREIKQTIYEFMFHFQKKTRNIHFISQEMHRQRSVINIKEWFRTNIQHFS